MTLHDLLPYASSLAVGLLIGFERERNETAVKGSPAGSRTFTVLALCGTIAATLGGWVVAAGLVVVGAIVVVGYVRTSVEDPGATTELAALATYLLGALAKTQTALAAGLAIIMIVLLSSKRRIHTFARDIVTDAEVEDAVKFLVMAFVVLPLLPNRDVGPYGVLNPERIWQLVVALTGISWAGYIATRILGAQRGLLIAGLAGGFISASATTASMARLSRTNGRLHAAVAGALLASLATLGQLAGIVAIADRRLLASMWPALLAAGAALLVATALTSRRGKNDLEDTGTQAAVQPAARPFGLRPALLLATVLTIAVLVGRWVVDVIGPDATMLASGAAGLADAHAGALSAATLHRQGQIGLSAALLGVGAAIITNTGVKCILSFTAGGRRFGWRFCLGAVPAFSIFLGVLAITARTA